MSEIVNGWRVYVPDFEAHRSSLWVCEGVRIRDNATGEVRPYEGHTIVDAYGETPSDFMWADGNYSCDCNRRLFFRRAGGEDDEDGIVCGDGAYSVQVFNPVDGRVFYDEFVTPPPPHEPA